jgi:hypothetical protein
VFLPDDVYACLPEEVANAQDIKVVPLMFTMVLTMHVCTWSRCRF